MVLLAWVFEGGETLKVAYSQPISSPAAPPAVPPPPDGGADALPLPGTFGGYGIQSIEDPVPATGNQELLVILVDFPDRQGIFTGQEWWQFFFGLDGFADYFEEISYNQLRLTGDIVGMNGYTPVFNSDGVAYVRLPNSITFYADGQRGVGSVFPRNIDGVVYHALQALDGAGFDFSPYANPATDKVENLVVVFAGRNYAYARDPNNSLQATAYSLVHTAGRYTSTGGQFFENYTFCPEQRGFTDSGTMANIGICAHEHGHGMGALDLYDFSALTSGAGRFSLMAYGAYGATEGQRPFHPGPFSKELIGWITPTVASLGTHVVTLDPAESGASFIKMYPNGNADSLEYFVLENRQALGFDVDWTGVGLCPGLVIWHIDQDIVQRYPYYVNSLPMVGGPPHQGVIVVEADGGFDMITPPMSYGECSDTWTVGQTWDVNSAPSSGLWDGSDSQLAVTVLDESGGSVVLATRVGEPFSPSVGPLEWETLTYINGGLTDDLPLTVVSSDTVAIVDRVWITSTASVTFTMVESWTRSLDLTDWTSHAGSVVTTGDTLSWNVNNAASKTWHTITTTFQIVSTASTYGTITESLWVEDIHPQPGDRVSVFRYGAKQDSKAYVYLPVIQVQD
jgi:M6 family metalloprotease-like protein